MLTHKGCEGELYEEPGVPMYDYEYDDGRIEVVNALMCERCGVEVIGDNEISDYTKEV